MEDLQDAFFSEQTAEWGEIDVRDLRIDYRHLVLTAKLHDT